MVKALQATNNLFEHELQDFLRFVWRPTLGPRLPHQAGVESWQQDCLGAVPWKRLLQWALTLWLLNLLVLGPMALSAASAAEAQHRLDMNNIPWGHALLWAPLVEELVFRYGLRQPLKALWLMPLALPAMLMGPGWVPGLLVSAGILLCWWLHKRWRATWRPSWRWHVAYRRVFPFVMHGSCLAFGAVHLHNFSMGHAQWWLLPLMVAPQWLTGLVLAWLRVRRGLGASIVLHAIFNGGPLLLIFIVMTLTGGEVPSP